MDKLIDTLWTYQMTFKTNLGMSPYRAIYDHPYHLPVALEDQAWWAIRTLNYDLNTTGEERKLSLMHSRRIEGKLTRTLNWAKKQPKSFIITASIEKSSPRGKKFFIWL